MEATKRTPEQLEPSKNVLTDSERKYLKSQGSTITFYAKIVLYAVTKIRGHNSPPMPNRVKVKITIDQILGRL